MGITPSRGDFVVPEFRRSRLAVGVLYLSMSAPIGGWAARVPEVRSQIGADDEQWGLANSVPAAGNAIGICAIAVLVGRVRGTVLAPSAAAVVLLSAPLTAASTSLTGVVLGLTTWALAAFVMAVPMGAMALEAQRRYGRPIMGSFDLCFGTGVLAGGATGTVAAALDVHPLGQLSATSGLLGLALITVARWLPDEAPTPPSRPRRRFDRQLLTVAALAFLSGYVTEATILWSSLYVADTLHGGPILGGAAYTVTTAAGIAALMLVDRATHRFGAIRLFRMSTLLAATGLGVCLTFTSPFAAIIGFAILSAGTACVNPVIYTLAGNQRNLTASEGVSVVEIAQMPGGSVAAPALIGVLSGLVGLRIALTSVVVAALLLALVVGRVTPHTAGRGAPRPRRSGP
jgi:MFS family permease